MPVLAEALAPLTEARGHSKPHVGSSTGDGSSADDASGVSKVPPLFSRFQNLLHPDLHPDPSPPRAHGRGILPSDASSASLNPDERPFVKIRFLTWNMHESLPKGDLTPLLGSVPAYVPPTQAEIDSGHLPQLPLLEAGVPPTYHMIVISGQETPTPSGIPLGLAAVKWGAGHSHTSTPSIATHATSPFAGAAQSGQPPQPSSPQAPARITALPHSSPVGSTQATRSSCDSNGVGSLQPPAFSLSLASPTSLSNAAPSPAPSTTAPAPLTALAVKQSANSRSNLSLQIPGSGAVGSSSAGSSGMTSKTGSPTSGQAITASSSSNSAADIGSHDVEESKSSTVEGSEGVRPDAASVSTAGAKASQPRVSEPKGWSELLEDWFCNRAGEPSHRLAAAASSVTAPPSADVSEAEEDGGLAVPAEPSRSRSKARVVEEGLGAYQLVRKERMLGIYLAVFIWKGASHLLQATSGSYVTTGLIGGRWGNKGGVAISVKLANKRLLFINSHLAAHASRSDVRLLNVAKIKSELSIDAFLESGDHRTLLEDPTDRFDSTFWCGDLNYRLDITRLHADWLMSRKAYEEAFQFDQLRKIMEEGRGFEGFKEAPIDFPPTYKYDLFKPVKRSNTKTARRRKNKSLSEVQEDGVVEEDDDEGPEVDSSSILSTGWTSVGQHSDYHSEVEGELEDDAIAPEPASLGQQSQMLAGKMVSETKKLFLPSTVLKGKRKILNLIKPTQTGLTSAPSTPSLIERRGSLPGSSLYSSYASSVTSLDLDRKKSINSHASSFGGQVVADPSSSGGSAAGPSRRSLDGNAGGVASPPRPAIKRQLSSKIRRSFSGRLDLGGPSPRDLASDDDTDDESAGPSAERTSGLTSDVYDTSAKARVPSWCDRILFKSLESDYPLPAPSPPLSTDDSLAAPLPSRLDRFTSALNLRKPGRLNRSVSASSQLSHVSHSPTVRERTMYQGASTSSSQTSLPPQLQHQQPTPSRTQSASATQTILGAVAGPPLSPSATRAVHVHWSTSSAPIDGDVPPAAPSPSRRSSLSRYVLRQRSNSASHMLSTDSDGSSTGKGKAVLPHLDLHVTTDLRQPTRVSTAPPSGDSPTTPTTATSLDRPGLASEDRRLSAPPASISSTGGGENRSSWFARLLTTFTHGTSSSTDDLPAIAAEGSVPLTRVVRRRGEVLPLQYGTLDDQDMRVLKGYSDHRPVIGVFAIFI